MAIYTMLNSARLKLAKLDVADLSALVKQANNPKIAANVINIPHPYSHLNASMRLGYVTKGFKDKTRYCYAIYLKESNELIGEVSLHETDRVNKVAELGYWIGEAYWNEGYATEAVATILTFGLEEIHFKTIYATCYKENEASQKVLVRNDLSLSKENGRILVYSRSRK